MSGAQAFATPHLVNLAEVAPEEIDWLWPGRLALGKLTLLVGDPGLGKSWATLDVTARLTAGLPWPDGAPAMPPCDVLLMTAEDGLADTIRPRLDRLGADVRRVFHVGTVRELENGERGIQLADLGSIEGALHLTAAKLLVIDPLTAYLGDVDAHRDAEVRALLTPLVTMAEQARVAVLGVMHLRKQAGGAAVYRPGGSIAFAAQARVVLAVGVDPQQPHQRLVVPVKSNLTTEPPGLSFTLADGRLTWGTEPVSMDAERLLSPGPSHEREEATDAEQVVATLLDDEALWPLDAKRAIEAGRAHGVHERSLQRAAKRAGVRISRVGFGTGGRWVWHRPIPDTGDSQAPRTQSVSPMSPMAEDAGNRRHTHIDDKKNSFPRAREVGEADADRV